MTDRERIEAAYAHMDAESAAHLRGEETEDERRLRDARTGLVAPADDQLPEELRFLADEETPEGAKPETRRVRRPRPSEAARAWLARQEASMRRKRIVVETPAQALEVWEQVSRTGAQYSDQPEDSGERSEMEGSPIAEQVWAAVRETSGYDRWRLGDMNAELRDFIGPLPADMDRFRRGLMTREGFESMIEAWPLPKTFFAPLPALCGKEIEELAKGRAEIEWQIERESRGDDDGRLMPGLVRGQ